MMPPRSVVALLAVALGLLTVAPASAQSERSGGARPTSFVSPCDSMAAYHTLDFWVGEWEVMSEGARVGRNRIDKVVHGCALIENWVDANGVEGKSLFYFVRARKEWKQVWVAPGSIKEKHLVATLPGGAVRFQGDLPMLDGSIVLDRTTLTPLPDGSVRQVIEQSRDGGTTWQTTFDARYVRAR